MHFSIQINFRWILQLINGISNDLQKLLGYFNETRIFAFFAELFVLLTASAVFPTTVIFKQVRTINSQISIIIWNFTFFKLPYTSWCVWIIITVFNQIVHRHCNVNMIRFTNKFIINFWLSCRKWCSIFKCNICIIVCSYYYISCNLNKCIRIIKKVWFNTFCPKFNRITLVVFIFCCLTVYNIPFFVDNLDSSLLESFSKFIIFYVSILFDA